MSLSIVKRPEGYRTDNVGIAAAVSSSSGALFSVLAGHGLVTGDHVYIYSKYSAYNGFWYVNAPSGGTFRIYEYSTATAQPYVNGTGVEGDITFFKSQRTENWMCAHLPIVFKIKSTLWPVNTVDTSRTVSSFASDGGFVKLTLSGSLGASFNALDYVLIAGATTSAVNGVFQILTKSSSSVVTINLAYLSTYNFGSGTVIRYYNNYCALIQIFAGIDGAHVWTAQKPFKQILTLSIIPDGNNTITLNVNELVKTQLNVISNNLQLDELPNNIDAWTQFYIKTAESYDLANPSFPSVQTFLSSYTDDSGNFEGVAINAKLPFKNRFSGFMMDYVYGGTPNTLLKFLTNFVQPSLFPGNYFGIGFLMTAFIDSATTVLVQKTYIKGVLQSSYFTVVGPGTTNYGVWRQSISQIGTEDRQDIYLGLAQSILAGTSWTLQSTNHYTLGANTLTETAGTTANFYSASQPLHADPGQTVSFNITVVVSGVWTPSNVFIDIYLTNAALTPISPSIQQFFTVNGTYVIPISLPTGVSTAEDLFIDVGPNTGTGSVTMVITIPSGQIVSSSTKYSETKTINIDSQCELQSRYITWLNNLGGYEYWNFIGRKTYGRDIVKVTTQDTNLFTNWPNSYGEFAQTQTMEVKRLSKKKELVRSQNLTADLVDAIATIKSSPVVQILDSQYSQRTVLVDTSSFDIRKDGDKTFSIEFTITYTDEIPSQEV